MEADELKLLGPNAISDKIASGEFKVIDARSGRSKVWMVFGKIANQHGQEVADYAYCRGCEKILTYKSSTSNLVKHKCYGKFINTENDTSKIEEENPEDDSPANKLTKLLTKWVIKDHRPYELVQNDGLLGIFQEIANLGSKFSDDLDIRKLLPTALDIEHNVSAIYEQSFKRVKLEIAAIKENGFGLTADIWSDNLSKQSYLALTIHYLQSKKVNFRLLGLRKIDEKSTNQNIAESLTKILDDFDCQLSSKSIIVTDQSIFKTVPDIKHLPCISHLIDCALLKAVEEVADVGAIVSSCLKLVDHLRKIELNSILGGLFRSCEDSRWILIYKMLILVESNWNEIVQILEIRAEVELVKHINIHHLKAMIKSLQPFEEAIETLEDDSCATLHLVLVYLHELKKSCDTNDSEFKDFDFIERLKENLYLKIQKIVKEDITVIHKLALFLYPPTNKLLQFSDKDKQSVDDECTRLMKCYKTPLLPKLEEELEMSTTAVSKRRKLFSDFVETVANQDPTALILQELQYYKSTRVVNSGNFDLFGWWELQKDNFPLLYKLSCNILLTPATSAASKGIWSAARNLLVTQGSEAEKIMFINSNCEHDELDNYFSVCKMT